MINLGFDFERRLDSMMRNVMMAQSIKPLNFGAVPGPSGGTGAPIGGYIGQLSQVYITYDTTEAATNTPSPLPSGVSLVTNLNKIRYDISEVDSRATTLESDVSSLDSRTTITESGIASLGSRVTTLEETSYADSFLDLSDTPVTYSGHVGKMVVVASGETSLEFVDHPTNSGFLTGTRTSSTTVSGTIVETTVFTGEIPGDSTSVGRVYQARIFGAFSVFAASQSLTARAYVGATEVAEILISPSNITNEPFHGLVTMTVRSVGETGTVSVYSQFYVEGEHDFLDEEETINTTIAEDITITFEWGAANDGNIVKITQGYMEVYVPQ